MKRFYKQATAEPRDDGYAVLLDGRPVRTPARNLLLLPTPALAQAVAAEWDGQDEEVKPQAMPLTGLANGAIDRVAPDVAAFVAPLAAYADNDVTCFRASDPPELVAEESAAWDPLVEWARQRLDLVFVPTSGLGAPQQGSPQSNTLWGAPQPPETRARVEAMLAGLDAFRLAGLDRVVRLSGSALIGLAVLHGRLDGEEAFAAGHVEELYQMRVWGDDALAAAARADRKAALLAAAHFIRLSGDGAEV